MYYYGPHMKRSKYKTTVAAIKGAKKLGANFLQIFPGSNIKTTLKYKNILNEKKIKEIKSLLKKDKMKIVIHSILTLNLCSPISARYRWNLDNLIYDLEYNEAIKGMGVVIHMGTWKTKNFQLSYEEAEKNYIKSITTVLKETKNLKSKIILETSCNQPHKIGGTIEKFARIYKKIPKKYCNRIGICIDTAHIFAAGYDISKIEGIKSYFDSFNKLIGIKNITLIHLNDSMREFDSRVNRHASLEKGYIFSNNLGGQKIALKEIISFSFKHKIPLILETSHRFFRKEINLIKSVIKKGGGKKKDIKKKLINIFKFMYEFHSKLGNNGNTHTQFRALGYRRALNNLEKFKGKIYDGNDVKDIGGFGKSFIEKVNEIAKTGTLDIYEKLKKDPKIKAKQIFQNIMGIGPKIANDLVMKHKIFSIPELKKKVKDGTIKLNETQKLGLKYYNDLNTRIPRKEISEYKEYFLKKLKKLCKRATVNIAGSYRIGKKDSGDIDVIISRPSYKDKNKFMEDYINEIKDKIVEIISKGKTKYMILIKMNKDSKVRKVDLVFIDNKQLPWYLLYFGSDLVFARKIRAYVSTLGYKLNEKGIYYKKNNKRVDFNPKTEKEIFEFLKLKYIKPSNRPKIVKIE